MFGYFFVCFLVLWCPIFCFCIFFLVFLFICGVFVFGVVFFLCFVFFGFFWGCFCGKSGSFIYCGCVMLLWDVMFSCILELA